MAQGFAAIFSGHLRTLLAPLRLRAFVTISRDKAQQGTAGLQKFKKREGRVAEMKGKKGKKLWPASDENWPRINSH
jgi:hypothetical protein